MAALVSSVAAPCRSTPSATWPALALIWIEPLATLVATVMTSCATPRNVPTMSLSALAITPISSARDTSAVWLKSPLATARASWMSRPSGLIERRSMTKMSAMLTAASEPNTAAS